MQNCKVCSQTISKAGACYTKHFRSHRGNFLCLVEGCTYTTKSKSLILKHEASHTGLSLFTCPKCEEVFRSSSSLTKHKTKTHKKSTDCCNVCSSPWDPETLDCSNNASHYKQVKIARFICCVDGCKITCDCIGKMIEHVRTHTNARPFACKECSYRSPTKRSLRGHVQSIHTLNNKKEEPKFFKTKRVKLESPMFDCIECKIEKVTGKFSRCFQCNPYAGSSHKEQICMKAIVDELDIKDLIFGHIKDQYRIPETKWRVDGYSPSTNTIFEYHSNYFHGIVPGNCTVTSLKQFTTLKRMDTLIDLGYTVKYVWGDTFLHRNPGSIGSYLITHEKKDWIFQSPSVSKKMMDELMHVRKSCKTKKEWNQKIEHLRDYIEISWKK